MLLEFACSNHKSVRDEVVFSALASKDNTFEEKTKEIYGARVLKSAVIYGANGSGKSNFIDAVAFVKNLVTSSIKHQPGQGILNTPHKLDGFKRDSTYRIQFVVQGIRYAFGFSLHNMLVSDEYLYYFPDNRQEKIYERSGEKVSTGNKFRGKFNTCKKVIKPNRLMLSCAANFSAVQEVADAYDFFRNDLVLYGPANQKEWILCSLCQLKQNHQMKQAVLKILSGLGTGISDITVDGEQNIADLTEIPHFCNDVSKALFGKSNAAKITARIGYGIYETDLRQEEASGIQKLFGILFPVADTLLNGKVLVCDGLEHGLHKTLALELARAFIDARTNKFAQLFFTTHDTGFLNSGLFRRDQIWFAEMRKEDRSTDLYSLAEIRGVRNEDNWGRGYFYGRYGAIPMLNHDFASIWSEIQAGWHYGIQKEQGE